MGKKTTERYLNKYITRLKTDLASVKVILYGSFNKGNYRQNESDIDLLVISPDFQKMDDDERFDFLYKKTVGLPLDWHLYGFTPREIKNVSPLNSLSEALRTGKEITI